MEHGCGGSRFVRSKRLSIAFQLNCLQSYFYDTPFFAFLFFPFFPFFYKHTLWFSANNKACAAIVLLAYQADWLTISYMPVCICVRAMVVVIKGLLTLDIDGGGRGSRSNRSHIGS